MNSYLNSETPPPIMQGTPPPPEWRVPRLDWDRPPWNRWSFQHVQELLPTAPVRRGKSASDLPAAHEPIEDIEFEALQGTTTIARWIDDSFTDGLMVMKDGHVVETGLTDQVLDDPQHGYTQLLVSSVLQA